MIRSRSAAARLVWGEILSQKQELTFLNLISKQWNNNQLFLILVSKRNSDPIVSLLQCQSLFLTNQKAPFHVFQAPYHSHHDAGLLQYENLQPLLVRMLLWWHDRIAWLLLEKYNCTFTCKYAFLLSETIKLHKLSILRYHWDCFWQWCCRKRSKNIICSSFYKSWFIFVRKLTEC